MTRTAESSRHNAYAADYDQQVKESNCHITDLLFGLLYEHLEPGKILLDAGIGSGLSSELFVKAGIQIHGMDFARDMLEICQSKRITRTLAQHDVQEIAWPYPNSFFDFVICCGVMHFLPDLENLFSESSRLIKNGGWFAFTSKINESREIGHKDFYKEIIDLFEIYSHSSEYIRSLMDRFHFKCTKSEKCLIGEESFMIRICQQQSP